jgi:peptidyl-prolyl cis-trans isomerase D
MLDIMRKHAGSWMIKILLGAIIIVFCFWGIGSWSTQKANVVAKVNEEMILVEDYQQAYDQLVQRFRGQFGNQLDEDLLKSLNLRGQALNQLIDRTLMLQEAQRIGLRVTDAEVAESIKQFPAFQQNGQFNKRLYANLLTSNRLTPESFEVMQRDLLLIGKLQRLVTENAKVSEEEIKAWYDWELAEVNIDSVLFAPDSYAIEETDPEELKRFFEERRDDYKTTAKREAHYLRFGFEDYADQITISPEEVSAYYDANIADFKTPKTVEARHILFKVDEKDDAALADSQLVKAKAVYEKAKAGEDFAELAKIHSEGPTKDNGGYLGTFERQSMVAPFADKAFSMEAGAISEPVRTRFGWHIIKVEKVNPAGTTTLEDAQEKIVKRLNEQRSKAIAYDQVEMAFDAYDDNLGLKAFAADRELPIQETGLFDSQGPKDVADASRFAATAFKLEENDLSDITELADGYYLIQVVKTVPSTNAAFETVEDDVRQDLVAAEQDKIAKSDADKLLEAVRNGGDFVAESQKFEKLPSETGYFKRTAEIPGIGYETALSKAAFELTASKPVAQEVIKGSNGYYVIQLRDRRQPPEEGLGAEKERIGQNLLRRKQSRSVERLLADVRDRSQIEIDPKYSE